MICPLLLFFSARLFGRQQGNERRMKRRKEGGLSGLDGSLSLSKDGEG